MSQTESHIGAPAEEEGIVHEVYFSPSYRRLLLALWVGALVVTPVMAVAAVLEGRSFFWFLAVFNGVNAIVLPITRNAAVVRVLEDGSVLVRSSISMPWRHRLASGWRVVEKGPRIVFLQGARTKAAWPVNALGWRPEEVPRLLSLNAVR